MSTEGKKYDQGKLRWSLIPWDATALVTGVLEHGARKYGVDNWKRVPGARDRYFNAAMRHLLAWYGGEDMDEESGLPHLAHAICCLLFLLDFSLHGYPQDT